MNKVFKRALTLSTSGFALAAAVTFAAPAVAQQTPPTADRPLPSPDIQPGTTDSSRDPQAGADANGAQKAPTGVVGDAGDDVVGQGALDNDSRTNDTADIVVTGTNISGVKPVGSEAVTLTRETIIATGLNSAADVVRTLPQVRNLGEFREGGTQGSANSQQGNAINLRGLGQQATLTLVDGHRLVATGASTNFTEANQVPLAALARIEVIADGASAVYGSDAVAGVVNFVLRKDYDGIEASVRATNQNGGFEMTPSLTAGKTWSDLGGLGGGNILVSYEYTWRDPYLRAKNRFLRQDLSPFGGPDNRLNGTTATASGPGNIYVQIPNGGQNATLARAGNYTYYGLPQGSNVGLTPGALLLNQPNIVDSAFYTDYTGEQKRHQVSVFANQNLGESIELFVQGSYSNRKTFSRSLNTSIQNVTLSPFLFNAAGVATTTPNPFYIAGIPNVAAGTPLNVQYSTIKDFGSSNFDSASETYSITGGVRVDLPFSWNGEAYYTYGRDEACNYCQTGFNVNPTALQYQINLGAINPLSGQPLTQAQRALILGDNVQRSGNGLDDLVVKFDGPLFRVPGGTVRAALGGERNKAYNFNVNGANRNNNNAFILDTDEAKSRLGRTIWSAFGELYLPIIGEDMDVPLIRSLTIDGAIRYDDYSDVGSTTNPKIGGTWVVNDVLSLRGSWGTSFRAPSLPDVNLFAFSYAGVFPVTNRDPRVVNGFLNLPAAGLTLTNLAIITGSNPQIGPEKATNWSVGGDVKLGDFTLNATYYNIKYTDRIAGPDAFAAFSAGQYHDYRGYSQFILPINNPATCSNANLASADPILQRYLSQTLLYGGITNFCSVNVLVDQRNANLAATKQDGIDGTLAWQHRFNELTLNASAAASWTLSNDQQVVDGQPFVDRLGFYSTPIEWRGRGSLGALWRGFSTNAFLNYTGSYTNDIAVDRLGNAVAPQKVGEWITVDLTVGYATALEGRQGGPFKGLRGSFSIQNLFDRDPPITITGQGAFNGSYSNPFGRTATVQLTATF
jgi:iron complex outermembrane receptor protein